MSHKEVANMAHMDMHQLRHYSIGMGIIFYHHLHLQSQMRWFIFNITKYKSIQIVNPIVDGANLTAG